MRHSASWLEDLLLGQRSVEVVLWGATAAAAPDGAGRKTVREILRQMRQLRMADLKIAEELKALEGGFFDAGGDWTADPEPQLRASGRIGALPVQRAVTTRDQSKTCQHLDVHAHMIQSLT